MDAAARLSSAFVHAHPREAARLVEGMAPGNAAATLVSCPPAAAARLAAHMAPPRAAATLGAMSPAQAARIMAGMDVRVAADVLRRMPAGAEAVLAALPEMEGELLGRLLRYPDGTAGALMDPLAFTLPGDITVAEARRRLQRAAGDLRYYIYVVDRDRKLIGVLNIRDFVLAAPGELVSAVMRPDVARLPARTVTAEIARHRAWRGFQSMPVVEDDGTFLGVLSYEALRRVEADFDPRRPEQRLVDSALAVGELYWIGMTGLIETLAEAAAPLPAARQPGGPDDDR